MAERVYTVDEFERAASAYRQQQNEVGEQLKQLEEQRVQLVRTLHLLQGAFIAVETLRDAPALSQTETAPADPLVVNESAVQC